MDRKMRAARNNAAAKARKRAAERKAESPRCGACGNADSEHVRVPIPAELVQAAQESGVVCEVVSPPEETRH